MTSNILDDSSEKKCLFCANKLLQRSKEHVFPKWLMDFLDISNLPITPTHICGMTGVPKSIRSHVLKDMVEGRICGVCNNGWMSQLEKEAMPVLKKLISGKIRLWQFATRERLLISRWAVKTAYMLNWCSNYPLKVNLAHLGALYSLVDGFPHGVHVFVQQHRADRKLGWKQGGDWRIFKYAETSECTHCMETSLYRITVQIRDLLMMVVFWPGDSSLWTLSPIYGLHQPLWPVEGRLLWQMRQVPDFDKRCSRSATELFHYGMEVSQRVPKHQDLTGPAAWTVLELLAQKVNGSQHRILARDVLPGPYSERVLGRTPESKPYHLFVTRHP